MPQNHSRQRRDQRRAEALERQEARDKRSSGQQIQMLLQRGFTDSKEIKRLSK